jgi:hypothetical protein
MKTLLRRWTAARKREAYEQKLREARDAQRNGRIQEYVLLMQTASVLAEKVNKPDR